MSKLVTSIMLFVCVAFYAKAQEGPHDCVNDCVTDPTVYTYYHYLCDYYSDDGYPDYTADPYDPGSNIPGIIEGPSVFVIVNYQYITCNNVTRLLISDAVLVDDRNYWENMFMPYQFHPDESGCSYPNPMNEQEIREAVQAAVAKVGDVYGVQTEIELLFEGACNSLVTVRWPNGAFIPTVGDLGPDTIWLDSSTTSQYVPCIDICCKVKFRYEVIKLANGMTESTWVPFEYEGDEELCLAASIPDYEGFEDKMTAQMFDEEGNEITVYGEVESQEPCELWCSKYNIPCIGPLILYKTDLDPSTEYEVTRELSAYPTPVKDFVRFTSAQPIQQVSVYDMGGKKVIAGSPLENNELNTSGLENGVYLIQVQLSDTEVRTIKVLKQ